MRNRIGETIAETKISFEDVELISKYRWWLDHGYARSSSGYMHQIIMPVSSGLEIDHKDTDKLNNQRGNLRPCTHSDNGKNLSLNKRNNSGFKGVSQINKKWHSYIRVNGITQSMGIFDDIEEAAEEYNRRAKLHFGEFAQLNETRLGEIINTIQTDMRNSMKKLRVRKRG